MRGAFDLLSEPFPSHKSLTPREHTALAHIVRGASAKEVGRSLGSSRRTVEVHRASIMQKLVVKNTIDLVPKVLGE